MYTHEYKYTWKKLCISAHMQLLFFFPSSLFFCWQTQSYMHKHSPPLPDPSVYVLVPVGMPFSPYHSLYPSFCVCFPASPLFLWIIQNSTGVESAHKVENTINYSRMFKLRHNRGVWCQTVVVVDLRRIVLWGFREGVWGGTQGGGVFVVGGKLWLTGSPPFSNINSWERVWEGGGEEEEQ